MRMLLGALLWAGLAWGQTVKVVSKDAAGTAARSGLGFRVGEKSYVVTVLCPSHCTQTTMAEHGKSASARRVVSDWGRGLELYEIASPPDRWTDLKDFTQSLVAPRVFGIEGYPTSGTRPQSVGAQLLTASTTRHYLPLAEKVWEVRASAVPAGFAGAPLYDDERRFLGLVASQYLRMVPGSATRPADWEAADTVAQSHVLAIPASEVKNWVSGILDAKLAVAFFDASRDPKTRDERVSVGGVTFRQLSPTFSGGGNLSGDFPVGSGDGVGVGGGLRLELASKAFGVKATTTATAFPFAHLSAWHGNLEKMVASGEEVEIPFVLRKSPVTEKFEYKSFHSLADLFRGLATKGGEPLLIRTKPLPARAELTSAARGVAEFVSNFRAWSVISNDPHFIALMREIYLTAKVLQSERLELAPLAAVDKLGDLRGEHQRGWALATQRPSNGAPLIARFRAMRDALEKLGKK